MNAIYSINFQAPAHPINNFSYYYYKTVQADLHMYNLSMKPECLATVLLAVGHN